jgi:hypothetical protein
MKIKELHVKKIENPDFSDLKFKGKNLMTFRKSNLNGMICEIIIGQVKQASWDENNLYLKGFTLADRPSQLEKQTILGAEYCGRRPNYEMPLTNVTSEKDIFYEFTDKVNIDKLRDICDGKEQRLIINEDN